MKKWYILLIISLVLFCIFIYMNGFCIFQHDIQPGGSPAYEAYELLGIYIAGFALPWYVVTMITIFSFTLFISALIQILIRSKGKRRFIWLFTIIIPVILILFETQEREYVRWAFSGLACDVEYYCDMSFDEQNKTVSLTSPYYGMYEPITFSAPAPVIQSLKSSKSFNYYFRFRKNLLTNTNKLELVYSRDTIIYRRHLQWIDKKGNYLFIFRNLDELLKQFDSQNYAPITTPTK